LLIEGISVLHNEAFLKQGKILLEFFQILLKDLEKEYETTDLDEMLSKDLKGIRKSGSSV